MISESAIAALKNNPPPKPGGRKFLNAHMAHTEIRRLESLLLLEPSALITNVAKFNARVVELEGLLAAQVANVRATQAAVEMATPETPTIITEYEAINDPCDRVQFYRDHRQSLDRAYRDLPPPKQGHSKPTGNKLIDELNALNGAEYVKFYRANSAAIDAEYQKLNT